MARKEQQSDIPVVDSRIIYRGTTFLRNLNSNNLRDLESIVVLQDGDDRLAVLIPFELYERMVEV